jgi:uncharacterized protein (DUF4415 family)
MTTRSKRPTRPTTSDKKSEEKEFEFRPELLKRVPADKRYAPAPEASEPRSIKVRVNIYLDLDIVNYFKERAQSPDAAKYQTQINNALRAYIEEKQAGHELTELVNNEQFIIAVAERVQAHSQARTGRR